ncbi:MAG: hypothetical protein AUH85_00400 [Chloroflexi bacterium 13_1_40CM_4_68_4]|nr:MAG: hypothetical protein AUH85_00400 [Chloroflexi bacterium 13_1_40CM_4_68_4]
MLEALEIFDGAILLVVYLALTVFVPVAFFGAGAGIVATIIRIPLSPISRLLGDRGERVHPLRAFARLIVLGVLPATIGVAAVLVGLHRLAGGNAPSLGGELAAGAGAVIGALGGIQDAAIRSWTGLAPADLFARVAAVDGLRPLAVWTSLVGARLATMLPVSVAPDSFRVVFAAGVAFVAVTAIGLSPLRLLGALRRSRVAAPSASGPAGARGRGA